MFLAVVLFTCVPSMAYNNYANVFLNDKHYWHPAALMTVGQVSEVLMLAASPWLIARFGLHTLFATGIVAWCVRYLLLAARQLRTTFRRRSMPPSRSTACATCSCTSSA